MRGIAVRLGAALALTLQLAGCRCGEAPDPLAQPGAIRLGEALGEGVIPRAASLDPVEGEPLPYDGYAVRPVSLQVFEGFRISAALWLPDGPGPHPAVLVAHGHFGEGKASGESQAPAHAFARRGWAALAVDTPGVEEGDAPGRQVHFDEGAGNRGLLASAGTSAMAIQLAGLRAGLDYLEGRGDIGPIALTGASGGAVQSLYLLLSDPRPVAAALASFVPMPREARAGGCACDLLPGWPGPDPALYAAAVKPTLWLSELDQPRPPGLPDAADFEIVPGPHGYSDAMIERAAEWLEQHLGASPRADPGGRIPHSPATALASAEVGGASLRDLVAALPSGGRPALPTLEPRGGAAWSARCEGEGPRVIVAGGGPVDRAALVAAGLSPCPLEITIDEIGIGEGVAERSPYVEVLAGAIRDAAVARRADRVYAVRGWGLAAEIAGLPYAVRDPIRGLDDLDPSTDPAWVHAPGRWWGVLYPSALASGDLGQAVDGVTF